MCAVISPTPPRISVISHHRSPARRTNTLSYTQTLLFPPFTQMCVFTNLEDNCGKLGTSQPFKKASVQWAVAERGLATHPLPSKKKRRINTRVCFQVMFSNVGVIQANT